MIQLRIAANVFISACDNGRIKRKSCKNLLIMKFINIILLINASIKRAKTLTINLGNATAISKPFAFLKAEIDELISAISHFISGNPKLLKSKILENKKMNILATIEILKNAKYVSLPVSSNPIII